MNIVVSGADGNLGSAVVDKLLEENAQLCGLYSNAEKVKAETRPITKYAADLTDSEESKNVVHQAKSALGALHGAVLTVGGFAMGNIKNTSAEDIEKQIRLNFFTAYNMVKPLMQQMEQGGHIFLVGAKPVLNRNEMKDKLAYGLAKQLLFNLAEVINADRDKTGIQCSVIVPSIIDTPPNRESMPKANYNDWVKPEEIADTIYYHLTHPYLKEATIKTYGNVT